MLLAFVDNAECQLQVSYSFRKASQQWSVLSGSYRDGLEQAFAAAAVAAVAFAVLSFVAAAAVYRLGSCR